MNEFTPYLEILPGPQRQLYPNLAWSREEGFVLYEGTAVALYAGHRESKDFAFFSEKSLDKRHIENELLRRGLHYSILQEEPNTLSLKVMDNKVQLSFWGTIGYGRVDTPMRTDDGVLEVASPLDLMATKLKVILDRIEAKDYKDIATLSNMGVPLERGLAAAKNFYPGFPEMECLRSMMWFEGGDLDSLDEPTMNTLRQLADNVHNIPPITLQSNYLHDDSNDLRLQRRSTSMG